MNGILARVLDPKIRDARRLGKLRLRESKKLLRRAGDRVGPEVRKDIEARAEALAEALGDGNPGRIHKAGDKLGDLLDTHLDAYRKPAWRESVESIGVAVLVALLLRAFVIEAFKIPSGSMIPTLAIGDQIFVNKYVYGVRIPFTNIRLVEFATPQRGEVIVFRCPVPPYDDYIKRVVGVPGDEVMGGGGLLYINGQPVSRRYLGRATFTDRDSDDTWSELVAERYEETLGDRTYTVLYDGGGLGSARDFGPVTVPEGHLFMMGDNRDHSHDSRSWGFVPFENVLGRSLFVWLSWGKDGLNTERLGTWIE